MNKDVKRMHFAKLVEGECVEFKPEVECSDDGLVVTYTYKSLEDLTNEGFKELVIKPVAAPDKNSRLTFEYEETETQIFKKFVWVERKQ